VPDNLQGIKISNPDGVYVVCQHPWRLPVLDNFDPNTRKGRMYCAVYNERVDR
jgi:hypothetical protein